MCETQHLMSMDVTDSIRLASLDEASIGESNARLRDVHGGKKNIQQRNRRRHHHEQKPTTIDHHQVCTMARVGQSSYRQHVVGLMKLASGVIFVQIHHHILLYLLL